MFRILRDNTPAYEVDTAADGREALELLRLEFKSAHLPCPLYRLVDRLGTEIARIGGSSNA